MLILSDRDIATLLSFDEIMDAVEAAMIAYEKGEAVVPQRIHVTHRDNMLLCMPSLQAYYFGTKLVSVVPGNKNKNLPVTNGAMVLNETSTGLPIALLNASKLTALRTGAVGALGVKYLTPPAETSFGLIGCGVQGLHQAIFICSVRKISTVYYLDRSKHRSMSLITFLSTHHPGVSAVACQTTEELLRKTNIIIAATTSPAPVVGDDPDLLRDKHFISMGSYQPAMQELPDTVYRLAGQLVIDSELARNEVGDIINPLKKGILKEEDVFALGKIITGERKADVYKTTAFKSAGMALFDLFVARAMYEKAIVTNRGTVVEF